MVSLLFRCPKELARLQCWVDNNSSTTGNQTQEVAGQGSCDIVTMATECVGGFSLESINPLNLCG
ncbi:hypothetical protein DPMN_098255 [Dreissena polymorpha]|uniref:Uncharacterized protein n=1 Tax=Dreissena polymorpha TaxID=45954 RepID=A0A9D4LCP3_DREPO|nr:hypothetical protein DPMN_098255 [Dreissena polymorpha]